MQEDSLFTIKESSFKTSYSLISPDKLKGTVIRDAQTNLKGQSYEIHRDLTKYRWPEAPIVIQKSCSFLKLFSFEFVPLSTLLWDSPFKEDIVLRSFVRQSLKRRYSFEAFCETVPLKKITFWGVLRDSPFKEDIVLRRFVRQSL